MARAWNRVGEAFQFGPSSDQSTLEIGWSWKIVKQGAEPRQVRVEIACGSRLPATDLPAAARNAIRSRGATAVDEFLDQAEPPKRLVVSRLGVHAPEQAV